MTTIDVKNLEVKEPSKRKHKPAPMNNPPIMHDVPLTGNHHFKNSLPSELSGGTKNLAFYAMSIPVPLRKKQRLMRNLKNSKYINDYLNKYVCVENILNLNDHAKFVMTYGMNLLDCYLFVDLTEPDVVNIPQDAPKNEEHFN